jgi:hypothetical protein
MSFPLARSTLLTVSLMVAACSARSSDGDASDDAVVAASDTDSDYLVFQSRAQALAWFDTFTPMLASQGVVSRGVVPADDPRTKRVESILAGQWATIQAHFEPHIPVPQVIVFETDSPNAFIAFDPGVKKVVDAVLVQAPILDNADVDATILHEVGHLVLKHTNPDYQKAMTRYYRATSNEPLGLFAGNDDAVRAVVEGWTQDVSLVGAFGGKELNGAPVDVMASSGLWLFFQTYLQANASDKPSCLTAAQKTQDAYSILAKGSVDLSLTLSPADRAALDRATSGLVDAAKDCLPSVNEPFLETVGATVHLPQEMLLPSFRAADLEAIRGMSTMDALMELTARAQARVRSVTESPEFASYRSYTSEEGADDFAMTVLHHQRRDPEAMGREVLRLLPADQQAACEAELARGVPHYGLMDPHHSSCYRMFHSRRFTAHLQSGGEGVTKAAVPRPGSAPAATTRDFPRVTQN